jgi:hypothetical protein
MHMQIIKSQEHFLRHILSQRFQELDEFVRVEGLINNHPACLTQIGDGGDHRQLLACAAHREGHRCFASRCVATATHICIHHRRLVAPMNLGTLGLGKLLDCRIFVIQPISLPPSVAHKPS